MTKLIDAEDIARDIEENSIEMNGEQVIEVSCAKALIDIAAPVELCYQSISCSDCANYDKENYNCPRFCEVIRETTKEIKSRPHGKKERRKPCGWDYCSECGKVLEPQDNFCWFCGADMRERDRKMTCNEKCIHRTVCELKKYDFAYIVDCKHYEEPKPQGEWIPVSERLPERYKEVIVTDIETSETYVSRYFGNGYWDCDNGPFKNRIIAWQEKPKPYKEKGNENV